MNEKQINVAKAAYRAYGAVTDFKNYQGLPMPTWDALPEKIKQAWIAAADNANRAGWAEAASKKIFAQPENGDERDRITRELFEVVECLARTGATVVCCVGDYKPETKANFKARISAGNDHHMLDMLREILQGWSNANHEDADAENNCGKE